FVKRAMLVLFDLTLQRVSLLLHQSFRNRWSHGWRMPIRAARGEWQRLGVFNAFAIAAFTGMFFGGQLADRCFTQEKPLAFGHLIGGFATLGVTCRLDRCLFRAHVTYVATATASQLGRNIRCP